MLLLVVYLHPPLKSVVHLKEVDRVAPYLVGQVESVRCMTRVCAHEVSNIEAHQGDLHQRVILKLPVQNYRKKTVE